MPIDTVYGIINKIFKIFKLKNKLGKMNETTEKIQKLLDKTGDVYIPGGVYIIDSTLKIHDNTHLRMAEDAVLRLADNANCALMINDKLATDYNVNITIEGGTIDGNNLNQGRVHREHYEELTAYDPDRNYGILTRFVGVKNFRLCNLTFKDPESYPVQISMVRDFTVENITFDYNMQRTNMDGIHINGPAANGVVRNIKGATNDDMVALNCDDCYETEITSGVIENILVDGLFAENGYTAVRLLSCGHNLRNVIIRNIFGSWQYNVVSFTHHGVHEGECFLDNVLVDGCFVSKADPKNDFAMFWFAPNTHTGRVTLRNIHRTESCTSQANTIKIDRGATVGKLLIDDVTQTYTSGEPLELICNSGEVNTLFVRD